MFSSIKITYIALLWIFAGPLQQCLVYAATYDVVSFLTGVKPYQGDPVQIQIPRDVVEHLKNLLERNPKFLDELLIMSKRPSTGTKLIVDKRSLQDTEEKDLPKLSSLTAYYPVDTPITENLPKTITINGQKFVLTSRAKALWKHGFNLIKNLTSPLKNLSDKIKANGTSIPQHELKEAVKNIFDKKKKINFVSSEEEEYVGKTKKKGEKGKGKGKVRENRNRHEYEEEEEEESEDEDGEEEKRKGKRRGRGSKKEGSEEEDGVGDEDLEGDEYEDAEEEDDDDDEEDFKMSKISKKIEPSKKDKKKKIENEISGSDSDSESGNSSMNGGVYGKKYKNVEKLGKGDVKKQGKGIVNGYDGGKKKSRKGSVRNTGKDKSSPEVMSESESNDESESSDMNSNVSDKKYKNVKKMGNGNVKKRGNGAVVDYDDDKNKSKKAFVKDINKGKNKSSTEETSGSDSDDENFDTENPERGKKRKDTKKPIIVKPRKPENPHIDKLINGDLQLSRRGNEVRLKTRGDKSDDDDETEFKDAESGGVKKHRKLK